jgi:hypothetical protein
MAEISAENSSTIVFPIPIEIMGAIGALTASLGGAPPPPVITQRPLPSDDDDVPTSAAEINDLPDVEVPPSEADPGPVGDAGAAPDAPFPDLPPPPTSPPPPPPPVA